MPSKISLSLIFLLVATSLANSEGENDWVNQLEQLEKIAQENDQTQKAPSSRASGTSYFNISLKCEPKPTSVHQLRPRDIDIVGAMGDSITAGFGIEATTLPGIGVEYRGLSWSVGGDLDLDGSVTITNVLRKFNPEVKGYSSGTNRDGGDYWFNVAVGGARSIHMPTQARDLIEKIQNDSRTNYENDWKLITIFIGGNDLCAMNRNNDSSPENYVKYLKEALDILHAELPRTMINVVEIMEIYVLPDVGHGYGSTPQCRAAQLTFCNYIVAATDEELPIIIEKNKQYQTLTQDLIASGRYDTRDDFTVVLQPFFRNTVLPYTEDGQVDSTYFAPDCFHFSSKGHALGAVNLWNNMLQPVGAKTTEWDITDLLCPSEEFPYIFTNLNSVGTQWPGSTTTEMPTTTTREPTVVTCPTNTCLNDVPDWGIAVLAIAATTLLFQFFALMCIFMSKKGPKHEGKTAEIYKNGVSAL
nr:phospholipase B1, membrane-associated-like [Ciona intestinalis]|eukprot:XP_002121478.1 phospholipase B1, membrane-associated-like [Ciona intestinalis]